MTVSYSEPQETLEMARQKTHFLCNTKLKSINVAEKNRHPTDFSQRTKDILYSFSSFSSSSLRCFSNSSCCRETSSRKLVSSSSKPLTMFSEEIIKQETFNRLKEKCSQIRFFLINSRFFRGLE